MENQIIRLVIINCLGLISYFLSFYFLVQHKKRVDNYFKAKSSNAWWVKIDPLKTISKKKYNWIVIAIGMLFLFIAIKATIYSFKVIAYLF